MPGWALLCGPPSLVLVAGHGTVWLKAIVVGVLGAASIGAVRWMLGAVVDDILPLVLLGVVAICGRLGGTWPGLLATGLGGVVLLIPVLAPVTSLNDLTPASLIRGGVYLATGAIISRAFGGVWAERARAEAVGSALAAREQQLREFHDAPGTADALRATEKHFHRLAAAIPQVLWAALPGGRLDYCNRPYFDSFGLTEGTALSTAGLAATLHPDDIERYRATWSGALRSCEPADLEYRLKSPRGDYRWHQGRFLVVKDESGRVERWFHAATDIHDHRRAEDQVRAGQRHLDSILQAVPGPFLALDPVGRVAHVNAQWSTQFGKSASEVLGRPVWEVFSELGASASADGYRQVLRDRTPVTFEQEFPDAGQWYEVHAFPTAEGVAAFMTDVTARRATHEAARAARDELEARVQERTTDLTRANIALSRGRQDRPSAATGHGPGGGTEPNCPGTPRPDGSAPHSPGSWAPPRPGGPPRILPGP